jgi:glycosyltransferase involved in cell wall biosynthesis
MVAHWLGKSQPLLTVGMPVFNGQQFLSEAITSILTQSRTDFELLIIDDASTDNSRQIIEKFTQRDSRIRVITNSKNQGLVAARNTVLNLAAGEFIAWNDQDDISSPHRLRKQSIHLQKNPDISILGSWTVIRNESSHRPLNYIRRVPLENNEIKSSLLFTNILSCNTVMMRRKALVQANLCFAPEAENALDYDLWTRCAGRLQMQNLPKILSTYRVHDNQNSAGAGGSRMAERAWEIQKRYLTGTLGEFSPESLEIHRLLGESVQRCATLFDPQRVTAHLTSLRDRNRDRQIFDQSSLIKALGTRWFLYTRARLGQHPNDLAAVLSALPTRWLPSTTARFINWRLRG